MIRLYSNCLAYLNAVTFYGNQTTNASDLNWGVNIHAGDVKVCMNNVTSYLNHGSGGKTSISFNSDGDWLVTNCTIWDAQTVALIRTGAASKTLSFCNNILINTQTPSNVFNTGATPTVTDNGYNFCSCVAGTHNGIIHPRSDWSNKSSANNTLLVLDGDGYEEKWNEEGKYYGVLKWNLSDNGANPGPNVLLEDLAPITSTSNPVTTTMGDKFDLEDSNHFQYNGTGTITNVGYDFYKWLEQLGNAYARDARGEARYTPSGTETYHWMFGAYHNLGYE